MRLLPAMILPAGARDSQLRRGRQQHDGELNIRLYSCCRRRHLAFHQFALRRQFSCDQEQAHGAYYESVQRTHCDMRLRHFVISFDFATCTRNPSECLYFVIVFDRFELRRICIRLCVADAAKIESICAHGLQHDSAIRFLKLLRGISAAILLEIFTTTANCCDCIMIWLHMTSQ